MPGKPVRAVAIYWHLLAPPMSQVGRTASKLDLLMAVYGSVILTQALPG